MNLDWPFARLRLHGHLMLVQLYVAKQVQSFMDGRNQLEPRIQALHDEFLDQERTFAEEGPQAASEQIHALRPSRAGIVPALGAVPRASGAHEVRGRPVHARAEHL